ncbi:MAG: DNA-3-methyladenine glycosylase 2 family protein [Candidatus Poseidonia sp.]|nr:DNA-3-methyladenine glycosylase 2 family protein [Poseidonia sp.]MBL6806056.1 DNA-3-methyladenine glycosylase 2 family protein [Poseidonia sp.]
MGGRIPSWWDKAHAFLLEDELLGPIVEKYGPEGITSRDDLFQTLIRSIVGQQISVTAADAIWGRLIDHLGSPTPEAVRATDEASIAACGITRPKASYIMGLARDCEQLMNQPWDEMDDAAIMKHLIGFRGIGPWTAEMMLMFHFLRPDIFSLGDIGLIRGTQRLVPDAETKEDVGAIAERWMPYRTAAAWYLWRILDPVPVEY